MVSMKYTSSHASDPTLHEDRAKKLQHKIEFLFLPAMFRLKHIDFVDLHVERSVYRLNVGLP